MSFAVTASTRTPVRCISPRIVGARRWAGSVNWTSEPSGARKWLPGMPWTAGATPVTIETLFGLVSDGITPRPRWYAPSPASSFERRGISPRAMPSSR